MQIVKDRVSHSPIDIEIDAVPNETVTAASSPEAV